MLIAAGYASALFRVVDEAAVSALSRITFIVFMPALLFRAMANTEFSNLSLTPAVVYFGATVPWMIAVVVYHRMKSRSSSTAATMALTLGFSNIAMMGIPIVRLAFGEKGLAVLLSVLAFHSLTLLTLMTVIAEVDKELTWKKFLLTIKSVLLHPVIVPIIIGLPWSYLSHEHGLEMPIALNKALEFLSGAAAPLALVLLGASLGQVTIRDRLGEASLYALGKLIIHPLLVFMLGTALSVDRLTLAVVCVAASMPAGANAYLFAQRYDTKTGEVSAAISVATLASVPILTALLHYFGVG